MDQDHISRLTCPAGIERCPVADEVERLKQECTRLSELTQTDMLTGLFSYRYLVHALGQEMERTRRTGIPTGLIMIDLDHFKAINDTYGHQFGNEALRWVGSLWRKQIRMIDIACRYGGEEFTLILPGTSLSQTVSTAERLRLILESSPIPHNGLSVKLSASFGASVFKANENLTVEGFLERADHFLLQAKSTGRNRVCFEKDRATRAPTEITVEERAALFVTRWPKL